jgi:NAD(P)-dependent dehydrogenase (short-subunit alcohol dehydrogenase family)
MDAPRLSGKVALITGGAYGIGRVYARALAGEGAAVAIADVDGDRTAATTSELAAAGCDAIGVHCDVADEEQVQTAVDATVDRLGGIDVLVNNAGVHLMGPTPLVDLPRAAFRRALEVNVVGMVNCVAAVRPSMRARGGGIVVNQLSEAAFRPGGGAYAISKLAARGLVATFAKELADDGIRVYGIAPGLVDSETSMAAKTGDEVDELVARQLFKRLGRMEDLAKALLFFCSDDASFITGETLIVGGGYPLRI